MRMMRERSSEGDVIARPAEAVRNLRFLVPREHGAWAMLLVPLVLGFIVGGLWRWADAVLALAALCAYLARYPLVLWARARFARFPEGGTFTLGLSLAAALLGGAFLLLRWRLWLLAPFAGAALALLGIHLALVRSRQERSAAGEFLGISGLALAGPAGYYTAGGDVTLTAFAVWLVNVAYFGISVYYVRLKLGAARGRAVVGRTSGARPALLCLTATLAVIAALDLANILPGFIVLAYAPLAAQVLHGVFLPGRQTSARRLGFSLVGHSIIFLALAAVFFSRGAG